MRQLAETMFIAMLIRAATAKHNQTKTPQIFAIGGFTGGNDSEIAVEAYDFQTAKWNRMPPLPSPRFHLGAATLNGKVYAIGGNDGSGSSLRTVDAFDPLTQKWTSAPNMIYRRSSFGVSVLGGKVYVVGGWNGSQYQTVSSTRLNSVEMFDGGRWTEIGRGMNIIRDSMAVGVLNGDIYAVGGWNGSECLKTVEKMNPTTGVWEFVASMKITRSGHCVAVVDGKLYAIGGENLESGALNILKSVEVYDPDLDRWTFVADSNNPRKHAGAVVYEGQIYVVGGVNPNGPDYDTTEVYNPNLNKWSILTTRMSTARWTHGVALL